MNISLFGSTDMTRATAKRSIVTSTLITYVVCYPPRRFNVNLKLVKFSFPLPIDHETTCSLSIPSHIIPDLFSPCLRRFGTKGRVSSSFEDMALKITDLPVDVLSSILASVGKSSNGAKDIAKSISVCKRFLEAGKSNIVYEVVCFKRIEVLIRHYIHFQRADGLLSNCASAGNLVAQFLLAQVILKSSTQLKSFNIKNARLKYFRNYTPRYHVGTRKFQEGYKVASLMANFTPGGSFRPLLPHWELIKLFLCNCTTIDIVLMRRHIQAYVEYFRGKRTHVGTDAYAFIRSVRLMCNMDEYKLFISLFSQVGFNYSLLSPSVLKWVFKRESDMKTADNLVEGVRLKAVRDFDCVSRAFPGFAVPRRKK